MLAACVSDEPGGPPTLDAAFVGYSDPATRQTTCGNCHITKQRTWEVTGHGDAWADLQASGHAAPSCNRCHTVNGFSNLAPDSTGFLAVGADAQRYYYDVQCESCHGPGAAHIQAPDETQPLTTIAAAVGLNMGCATCHSGEHTPFVEEWAQSPHANIQASARSSSDVTCRGCHDGRAALLRLDPDAKFVEQTSADWQPTTCAVCHDPHGRDNPAQLRRPIDEPDLATNLCMQCHYRRSVPDPGSSRLSPHSPEGPLLVNEAGWRPSTFAYDTAAGSTHSSERNPRLCAGCHVNAYSVTDTLSGGTVFTVGHRFEALPCLTAGGAPDTTTACDEALRSFRACAASGCHATEGVARNARTTAQNRMAGLVRTLWIDVDGDNRVDAFPTDSGLIPQAKAAAPADWTVNPTITVGEGAEFNAFLFRLAGTAVHNPFYAEALANATIDELRAHYGLPAPPAEPRGGARAQR
jgi:predicted CXXCH cytochrome family protein